MTGLVQFDKALRELFNSPPFDGKWGLLKDQDIFPKSHDYSVFKLNDQGLWNLELPVPGLKESDIEVKVDLENRRLTIHGQKEEKSDEETDNITYTKRASLNKQYSFHVDEKFDLESLVAYCENGLLKLEMKEIDPDLNKQQNELQIQVQGPKA